MLTLTSAACAPRRTPARPRSARWPPGRSSACLTTPNVRNLSSRPFTSEDAVKDGRLGRVGLERAAERRECAMKCDLDGVRAQAEDARDLLRRQVGAEAQGDHFAVALGQAAHGLAQLEPRGDLVLEGARDGELRYLTAVRGAVGGVVRDHAPCDPDQPRDRRPAALVVPLAVAQCPLEHL